MLCDDCVRDDRRTVLRADRNEKRATHQAVQRLPYRKLAELRFLHQLADGPVPVYQRQQGLLLATEGDGVVKHLLAVESEYDIEIRDFLLDERPFVDAPRAFEQQLLRIDCCSRHSRRWIFPGLEAEGTVSPVEHGEDSVVGIEHPRAQGGV